HRVRLARGERRARVTARAHRWRRAGARELAAPPGGPGGRRGARPATGGYGAGRGDRGARGPGAPVAPRRAVAPGAAGDDGRPGAGRGERAAVRGVRGGVRVCSPFDGLRVSGGSPGPDGSARRPFDRLRVTLTRS